MEGTTGTGFEGVVSYFLINIHFIKHTNKKNKKKSKEITEKVRF